MIALALLLSCQPQPQPQPEAELQPEPEVPPVEAVAQPPLRVWIDADCSAGVPKRDIDDAVAMIQAFNSGELDVVGISTVFGNAALDDTDRLGREVTTRFGPATLPVHRGAAQAAEHDTPAVAALIAALEREPLTILVLGPATNIAGVLASRPDLAVKMTEVIAVAGRRPGQRFTTGTANAKGHRDFNFEQDAAAFESLLAADVPLTLTPWEISSEVWITDAEIERWAAGPAAARWLAQAVPSWIDLWKERFEVPGFNPFDTLAVGYLTHPQLFTCDTHPVGIERHPNDVTDPAMQGDVTSPDKPYLLVAARLPYTRTATYCHTVDPSFREVLMQRLLVEAADPRKP